MGPDDQESSGFRDLDRLVKRAFEELASKHIDLQGEWEPDALKGLLPGGLDKRAKRVGNQLAWQFADAIDASRLLPPEGWAILGGDIWAIMEDGWLSETYGFPELLNRELHHHGGDRAPSRSAA
jgi:hypothetical protein